MTALDAGCRALLVVVFAVAVFGKLRHRSAFARFVDTLVPLSGGRAMARAGGRGHGRRGADRGGTGGADRLVVRSAIGSGTGTSPAAPGEAEAPR